MYLPHCKEFSIRNRRRPTQAQGFRQDSSGTIPSFQHGFSRRSGAWLLSASCLPQHLYIPVRQMHRLRTKGWNPDAGPNKHNEPSKLPYSSRHPGEGRRSGAGMHCLRTKGWNPVPEGPHPNTDNFTFMEGNIKDLETCNQACMGVDYVLHQAALGSVPRSIEDPIRTNGANIDGFLNMLVAARDAKVKRFVYAASSSTYGDHPDLPKVEDKIGNPLSPYAVTKVVNELYANVFARTYGFKTIGLR